MYSLCGLVLLIAIFALVLDAAPPRAVVLAVVLYGISVAMVGELMRRTYPHAVMGLCNLVTLLRMVIVAALASALVYDLADPWRIVAVAGTSLALDGVDGWLARRNGLVSAFGARFDMEVDAAFALILALYAFGDDRAGPLVLILGFARYGYVAAAYMTPWLQSDLPERFSRKVVCVLQLGVLIGVQVPLISRPVADGAVVLVAGALLWSFGRDVVWAWRNKT